jgi:hypothetical protein
MAKEREMKKVHGIAYERKEQVAVSCAIVDIGRIKNHIQL